jgi:choline-glycine betaine transporter
MAKVRIIFDLSTYHKEHNAEENSTHRKQPILKWTVFKFNSCVSFPFLHYTISVYYMYLFTVFTLYYGNYRRFQSKHVHKEILKTANGEQQRVPLRST